MATLFAMARKLGGEPAVRNGTANSVLTVDGLSCLSRSFLFGSRQPNGFRLCRLITS